MIRIKAEVDLKAIKNNLSEVTKNVSSNIKKIAVVKADAYGHGAVSVAKYLEKEKVIDGFAVATFEEASELRENSVSLPILILGYIDPENAKKAEELNITVSVGDVEYAKALFSYGSPKAHIQVDTGMSRMGVYCHKKEDVENALKDIKEIYSFGKDKIKGIYTHFVESDIPSKETTKIQYESLFSLIEECEKEGIYFETKHCCNSLGAVNFPEYALNAVRIGICLYGYESENLTPAMTFKTKIIKIFEGKKGDTVSYLGTYTLEENKKIAVCSAGYADGVSRQLSNKGYYVVNGKKANILGRVCMDLSMIDITNIQCSVGDEAVIFGKELPADEVASLCNTISYEALCNVSKRVPREYTK